MLADLGHSVVDGLSHRLFDKPLQRKQKYIHRKETLIAASFGNVPVVSIVIHASHEASPILKISRWRVGGFIINRSKRNPS